MKNLVTKENFEKYRYALHTTHRSTITIILQSPHICTYLPVNLPRSLPPLPLTALLLSTSREISLPATIRTLQLGVAVAQIAERENLSVDPVELQDQADLRRIEAERQGMDEKVRGTQRERGPR